MSAALLLALVSRFSPGLPLWLVLAGVFVLPFAALLTGTLYAFLRRRDEMETAIRADALLGLDERLATALESSRKARDISLTDSETLTEAQLDDWIEERQRIPQDIQDKIAAWFGIDRRHLFSDQSTVAVNSRPFIKAG